MKLNSTFSAIADKLRIDFERLAAEIDHHGQAGEAREFALRSVLEEYLPQRAPVGTGFVIDALGGQSRQMDIVIYDRTSTPVFDVSGKKYYPCETVLAVGQVKTAITSTDRLTDALENIASVKTLDRSNDGRAMPITGPGLSTPQLVAFDPQNNHRDQILGFIFTGASLSQGTLVSELQKWQASQPRRLWPNFYCDFNTFIVSYFSDALTTSAMEARGMYCTKPEERDGLLLLLFALLVTFIDEAHTARPKYFDYAAIESTEHDSYVLGGDTTRADADRPR
jgi:hypothetical protein